MALNIVSNYSANVAHRNLTKTDAAMSSSLAKLSAGSRVLSSKDDTASMAIGSRIASEVSALKQANVNAGQASSMLQIADGAMGTTQDVLTRMKTLAVQGASDNLSSTERSMIDTEYQSLVGEIDRVANDTEFNGTKLVSGSTAVTSATNSVSTGADNLVQAADGVSSIEFDSDVGDAAFTVEYNSTSNVLTVTDLTNGTSEGINIGATDIAQNATQEVRLDTIGATVTLNDAFDKAAAISADGGAFSATVGSADILTSSIEITAATGSGAQGLSATTLSIDSNTVSASASVISIEGFSAAGIDLTATGVTTAQLTDGTNTFDISFQVTTAFSNT
ncbi:MAG: flagellin, partial [Alphaproteobacteria bacterium]